VSENRGLAWIDYDNDGWQDLYVVDLDGSGRLYHNLGDPEADGHNGFELAVNTNTELTGLETLGAVAGDYNNDGYDDLFVSGFLLENQQDGTFQDVTAAKGLNVTGNCNLGAAAFGDVDSDGDLDLYAGSFSFASHCNYFFKNNGQGTGYSFTESSSQAGLGQSSAEATWAVVMTDYDNDRDLDIYIVNDFSLPNRLYENDGSGNFTFLSNGSDIRVNAMGVAVGDYDVDGDFDFFVTNVTSRNPSNTNLKNKLLRNDGASGFSEVATLAGVLGNERMPAHTGSSIYWGASFLDVDNDGYLDLYAANNPMSGTLPELNKQNRLYINDGDVNADGVAEGTFTEAILPVVNVEPGHGVARADYDNDGRMDIAVHGKSVDGGINGVMLLHNVTPQNNQWLKLRLVNESNSNARGIGAKIRLTSNDPASRTARWFNCVRFVRADHILRVMNFRCSSAFRQIRSLSVWR